MGDWTAALTVCATERGRLLTPLVRVGGRATIASGTVRVELVDENGLVRRSSRRPLPGRSLGRLLRMPCVKAPDGATASDVARWPWNIVVEDGGRDVVRWRRYLMAGAPVNAEAELEFPASHDPRRAKEESEGRGPEAPWDRRDSDRLLAVLVAEGDLSERDRDEILARRAASGMTVERALVERGWVDEHELLTLYAELTGSEFLDLGECAIDRQAASLIPAEMCVEYGLIAIGFRDDELLTVAMSDPQHPHAALDVEAVSWHRAYIVVATRQDVLQALETMFLRRLRAA